MTVPVRCLKLEPSQAHTAPSANSREKSWHARVHVTVTAHSSALSVRPVHVVHVVHVYVFELCTLMYRFVCDKADMILQSYLFLWMFFCTVALLKALSGRLMPDELMCCH